tara:strand:- start:26 stop:799 length:774 start_codon:yes stop_codon:yes gene_type:complete
VPTSRNISPDSPAPKEIVLFYYQFNIGDYASHTRNLSLLEDLAYRKLLDEYYLHEHPLNGSITDVARQIGMKDYLDEVAFVLKSFFINKEDVWTNKRADREIVHYASKLDQTARAGRASAEVRRNGRSTDVQLTNNQQPITNKQETLTSRSKTIVAQSACICPKTVSDEVWQDFLTLRRAKKAPLTNSALRGIEKEAGKAGIEIEAVLRECCARGWTGFKADWMKGEPFSVGAATRKILERELEKEARLINPWEEIQ